MRVEPKRFLCMFPAVCVVGTTLNTCWVNSFWKRKSVHEEIDLLLLLLLDTFHINSSSDGLTWLLFCKCLPGNGFGSLALFPWFSDQHLPVQMDRGLLGVTCGWWCSGHGAAFSVHTLSCASCTQNVVVSTRTAPWPGTRIPVSTQE